MYRILLGCDLFAFEILLLAALGVALNANGRANSRVRKSSGDINNGYPHRRGLSEDTHKYKTSPLALDVEPLRHILKYLNIPKL